MTQTTFQLNGKCYGSWLEARDAYLSDAPGYVVSGGTAGYWVRPIMPPAYAAPYPAQPLIKVGVFDVATGALVSASDTTLQFPDCSFAQQPKLSCTSPKVLNAAQTACIDPAIHDWSAVQPSALLWVVAWVVVLFMGVRQGSIV